jgi:excinuclease UvrABC nuclease subunit
MTSSARPPSARPSNDELPELHTWAGRPGSADLASLPGCPAVYLLIDAAGTPVQLATTQHLRRLTLSRLADPERPQRGKADLAEIVRGVRWRQAYSPFEGRWWYYRLARRMYPREYRRLISFGPAWFLNVDWQQPVPEIRPTERIWCVDGACLGPWPTHRSCHEALEGLWDLSELCRYPEQVRKAPQGTRCAYAEMGRCDAPCDGSAPIEAYRDRCRAAWRFACGGVREWMVGATARMQAAAAEQQYERAGLLKRQLAFAEAWERDWASRIRLDDQLNDLLAIPVTRRRAHKLFLFRRGHLNDGPLLLDRKLAAETPRWLAEQLAREPEPLDAGVRMEQTWLEAHFLQHKEAQSAIRVPLPVGDVPAGLAEVLHEQLESRRRAGTASGSV